MKSGGKIGSGCGILRTLCNCCIIGMIGFDFKSMNMHMNAKVKQIVCMRIGWLWYYCINEGI